MCCDCVHVTWGTQYHCNLHGVALPVEQYGADNLLCTDFAPGDTCDSVAAILTQFDELAPHMRKGYLYAFPYPSHDRVKDLREVMLLTGV